MADAQITVRKGDSIWKIAKRVKPAGMSTKAFVDQMIAANPELADPDKIKPGMVLSAPGAKEPPTPRIDPRREMHGKPGPPPAPADIQRGVEPTVNEVIVGRDGEVQARLGTEQFGPAGSKFDREAAMIEIARRQELTLRASVQHQKSLAAVLRERGYKNVTEVMAVPTIPDTPEVPEEPIQRNPKDSSMFTRSPKKYPREVEAVLPPPRAVMVGQAMQMPSAGDRGNYTLGDPAGLVEEGTINLAERPRVPNPDGTFSTVVSKSFEFDGREVLIPTLGPDGAPLSDDEAINKFLDTGEHLGVFKSPEAATSYAKRLSLGLGGPTHDPDAFVDMSSPRWREIFVEGNLAAAKVNRERRAVTTPPSVSAKVRVPTAPASDALDRMGGFLDKAQGVGSMGGGGNASK